jgi:hypothetical protein
VKRIARAVGVTTEGCCQSMRCLLTLLRKGFMSNYILWHQHGEVWPAVADESDGNDDVDQMDDMVADIGRGYDLKSKDPLLEVQNFYRLLTTSEEKVHNGTDMTVLQAVTHLMGFKSKYNFSNQCYNDIMKFVIDLIPVKHNILKDLYQSKKIMSSLEMDYGRIDACKKIACCFGSSTRMTPNVCIAVGLDT